MSIHFVRSGYVDHCEAMSNEEVKKLIQTEAVMTSSVNVQCFFRSVAFGALLQGSFSLLQGMFEAFFTGRESVKTQSAI